MIERFQFNYAHILVLSLLLQSFVSCSHPEFAQDVSSNADDIGSVIEEQRNKLDPSIEQIFRGPSQTRPDKANSKRNIEADTDKTSIQGEAASKRARVKRDNAVTKSNAKNLNDAKRSVSNGDSKAAYRIARTSRDLPKLPAKDYEIPLNQDKSEYSDEAEDDSANGPPDKDSNYKASEFRVGEDSERFVDQEDRSGMYDDFESKDVVKRGIPGADDYEEADDEAAGGNAEDVAALEDDSFNEETDKKKIQGDVRVKRDRENSRDARNAEAADKVDTPTVPGDSSADRKAAEASLKRDTAAEKDSKAAESRSGKLETDSGDLGDQAKRNAAEKSDSDASKANSDASKLAPQMANDQTEIESNDNAKQQNRESEEAAGDGKAQEAGLSSNDGAPSESRSDTSVKGTSSAKIDESKVAEAPSPELPKAPASVAEDVGKADSSKSEAAAGEQVDADYEKRVEEQIQRKIDSIKEEIKREIAENQRMKEIEENNARFDELREQEDDDEDALLEAETPEKRDSSKRSVRSPAKSEGAEKRAIRRKKRQDVGQEKARGAAESGANKKTCRTTTTTTTRKRSVGKADSPDLSLSEMPRKRERPRQVILVRTDGKKKRRRRSKNPAPADVAPDSGLRGGDVDGQSSGSKVAEDEKTVSERDSSSEKKSMGGNEDLGPLATEYGEAFGGLNGEPGVALARFKRIKRVLRPPASKT